MKRAVFASKLFQTGLRLWPTFLLLPCAPIFAQDVPATVRALQKQGVTVIGKMVAPPGMTAYAAHMEQQPVALYVMPDGKGVIAGTLFDANGNDLTRKPLEAAVRKPMSEQAWQALSQATWIADGRDSAPRKVYVFTDPNCPYCNQFWNDARPWVDSGKVQLRHIIVGILTPTSAAKAAALLEDKNPAAVLHAYEQAHASATTQAIAGGHPKPLDDAGLKPADHMAAATKSKLDGNEKLMASLGLQATPAILWRDANGFLEMRQGLPQSAMTEVLGPR